MPPLQLGHHSILPLQLGLHNISPPTPLIYPPDNLAYSSGVAIAYHGNAIGVWFHGQCCIVEKIRIWMNLLLAKMAAVAAPERGSENVLRQAGFSERYLSYFIGEHKCLQRTQVLKDEEDNKKIIVGNWIYIS